MNKLFHKWLFSKDCYGNRLVLDIEHPTIIERLELIKDTVKIVEGSLNKNQPNQINIDITELVPKDFQPNKKVLTTLAHFLRPCLCKECTHESQWECYAAKCKCCIDECT